MIHLISQGEKTNYNVYEYLIDTLNEINQIPSYCGAGSTALVIETKEFYIKKSNGDWEFFTALEGNSSENVPIQSNYEQNDETQPDYIKNRPFYEDPDKITKSTILSSTSLAMILNEQSELLVEDAMQDGLQYVIKVNDKENKFIAHEILMGGDAATYIGDNIMEVEMGALPVHGFTFATGQFDGMIVGMLAIIDPNLAFATFGITQEDIASAMVEVFYTKDDSIKKLDNKFLDLDWLPKYDLGHDTIFNVLSSQFAFKNFIPAELMNSDPYLIKPNALKIGDKVKVSYCVDINSEITEKLTQVIHLNSGEFNGLLLSSICIGNPYLISKDYIDTEEDIAINILQFADEHHDLRYQIFNIIGFPSDMAFISIESEQLIASPYLPYNMLNPDVELAIRGFLSGNVNLSDEIIKILFDKFKKSLSFPKIKIERSTDHDFYFYIDASVYSSLVSPNPEGIVVLYERMFKFSDDSNIGIGYYEKQVELDIDTWPRTIVTSDRVEKEDQTIIQESDLVRFSLSHDFLTKYIPRGESFALCILPTELARYQIIPSEMSEERKVW